MKSFVTSVKFSKDYHAKYYAKEFKIHINIQSYSSFQEENQFET